MATVSFPIGASNSGTNDWSDVHGEDQAIVDQVNGNLDSNNLASNAVSTAKIANLAVTDAKLASPNNSVYKTLLNGGGLATGATVAGSPYQMSTTGVVFGTPGGITASQVPYIWDYASGDYLVTGLTTKFRVKMQIHVGTTSPSTVTFTAGLYPLTGISAGNYTLGTVTPGSTVVSSGLATNTLSPFTGTDFSASALSSDPGRYVLAAAIGSITVPATITITMQLQTRNV